MNLSLRFLIVLALAACFSPLIACEAEVSFDHLTSNQSVYFFSSWGEDDTIEVDAFFWDLGDGSTSDIEDPVHTYPDFGVYNVCLTIFFNSGEGDCAVEYCQEIEIAGGGLPCQAAGNMNLSSEEFTIFAEAMVSIGNFTTVDAMAWEVDGEVVNENAQTLTHQLDVPGDHEVCLNIEASSPGNNCQASVCQSIEVETPGFNVFPEFVIKNDDCLFRFIQTTSVEGLQNVEFLWDFGDGTYSDLQQPEKGYAQNGDYEVCLSLTAMWFGEEAQTTTCEWITSFCESEMPEVSLEDVQVEQVSSGIHLYVKDIDNQPVYYAIHLISGSLIAEGQLLGQEWITTADQGVFIITLISGEERRIEKMVNL